MPSKERKEACNSQSELVDWALTAPFTEEELWDKVQEMNKLPSLKETPISQRLTARLEHWDEVSPWHAKILRQGGVKIPWVSKRPHKRDLGETKSSPEKLEILDVLHQKDLEQGFVAPETEGVRFTMRRFAVPKQGAVGRAILNCKPLNAETRDEKFRMEGVKEVKQILKKGDYMVTVDIASAFNHIPLHFSAQKFFQYWHKGELYKYVVLCFGWKRSPYLWCKFIKPVVDKLRAKGVHLVSHMDDFLLVAKTKKLVLKALIQMVSMFDQLGFKPNLKKSEWNPSRKKIFLGLVWDTKNWTVSLTKERLQKALFMTARALKLAKKGKPIHLKQMQSLLGVLNSTSEAINRTKLYTSYLQIDLTSGQHWGDPLIYLTKESVTDLQWWVENLARLNGHTLIVPLAWTKHFLLTCDAGPKGWGALYVDQQGKRHIYFHVINQNEVEHNNLEEFKALIFGVKSLQKELRLTSSNIWVKCDSEVVISYVRHAGGRKKRFVQLTKELYSFLDDKDLDLRIEYVRSEDNEADEISRWAPEREDWTLNRTLFNFVNNLWGPHTLDCFATDVNTQLARHISWRYNPDCLYTDFFSRRPPQRDLKGLYGNPPFSQIMRLVNMLEDEQLQMTVIVPLWRGRLWWPKLVEILTEVPLLIPRAANVFLQANQLEEKGAAKWPALAVRLSGIPGEAREFQRLLKERCAFSMRKINAEFQQLCRHMTSIGGFSHFGAANTDMIQSLLSPILEA